jgi:FkbM family methyltransferase
VVDMVPTLINDRWELLLPAHRAARPEWQLCNGGWEVERLAHMHDYIAPGQRVLYIGGEEGDMAGLLASWGADVRIVEPNDRVWPNIRAIWEANNLTGPAITFAGFCGKETSDNYMDGYHTDSWPVSAYGEVIGDHGFKELRDPGDIPVVTVDDLCMIPDVISLDVEGSEWDVLQGAEWTLNKYHPAIYLSLHPEFLIDQYGKYSAEVRGWLRDMGYHETLLAWPLHEAHFFYEHRG